MSDGIPDALRALMRTVHAVEAALARRLGVGVTDVLALQILADRNAGTVELARQLGIRSASATALVDRLQAAGHLRRVPHTTDGRRVVLELTDSARTMVLAGLEPILDAVDDAVAELDPDERPAVEEFLRRITDAFEEFSKAG
ncbi:DNA-binding transcriptional regulator, MarR family [Pseudonocardia thermophila]|uniref:DNA-binding transcriptional regulator, MarR family n=1 Tax=Pseudonocardia thermophila TaxID=1848 RepID=A0A1M6ZV97_PSETH|nr:MarR family transcriptional regulator [Pseudonocardia thermophila]SHL34417.1 DNA-binding transcriptional regulator, MarR family [Pseudonocardia thermophila]